MSPYEWNLKEREKSMSDKHGVQVIASSAYGDIIYASKWAACRALSITPKKLNRLIDQGLPVKISGLEYWLDELEEPCK